MNIGVITMDNFVNSYYLCTSEDKLIKNFECKKFNSFEECDSHFNTKYKKDENIVSTMLQVNYVIPKIFHKRILENKLQKMLIKINKIE